MKKAMAVGMVFLFVLATSAVSFAKGTCTVESISGDSVTLKCDPAKAAKLKMGDAVTVAKKKK